jgi:BioD-like phosphotransacetylase family protein
MKTLYITSAEVSSGKSALCVGLGLRLRKDGLQVGYMKPVNVNCQVSEGVPYDEDVTFARQVFEMAEPFDLLSPVALTPARLEQQLRGPETDYAPRLKEAFTKVSAGRDVMVLEGGRSLREGYVAGLPPKKVIELLDAQVLTVLKFDEVLMVDRALTAQHYFGEALVGLVINQVPRAYAEFVPEIVVPYLTRHGLKTFGVLPKEQLLFAPSVRELAEGLNAELLSGQACFDELVEHMLVGAMSADAALTYFRRKPHKAVITGGDRTDLQLAALETSTRCLILTGNLYPSPQVLNRAEEQCVPVILTRLDTLAAVQIIEDYFGRSRFQEPRKIERFMELLNKNFDFAGLYGALGITGS